MKKTIKIIAALFILFLVVLVTIPFLFTNQIKATITEEVNKTINATFSFQHVGLNVLTNFPNAKIELKEILITNKAPFENDTLVCIESISMKTAVSNLFSNKIVLDNFSITNGSISLKTNKDNVSNYDILKPTSPSDETSEATQNSNSSLSLHVEAYRLHNIDFNYLDAKSNLAVRVENFNHNGTGLFSSQHVALHTDSSIEKFTVASDHINLLTNAAITWNALLDINLETLKIRFKENNAN